MGDWTVVGRDPLGPAAEVRLDVKPPHPLLECLHGPGHGTLREALRRGLSRAGKPLQPVWGSKFREGLEPLVDLADYNSYFAGWQVAKGEAVVADVPYDCRFGPIPGELQDIGPAAYPVVGDDMLWHMENPLLVIGP